MYVKSIWKILVVEDEEEVFARMERAIEREATLRDFNIKTLHAATLADAKQKVKAYLPEVVSTDMQYPLVEGGPTHASAGAQLIQFVGSRHTKTRTILYSGGAVSDSMALLEIHGISVFPPVLQKNYAVSHEAWARATLDQLMVRT